MAFALFLLSGLGLSEEIGVVFVRAISRSNGGEGRAGQVGKTKPIAWVAPVSKNRRLSVHCLLGGRDARLRLFAFLANGLQRYKFLFRAIVKAAQVHLLSAHTQPCGARLSVPRRNFSPP